MENQSKLMVYYKYECRCRIRWYDVKDENWYLSQKRWNFLKVPTPVWSELLKHKVHAVHFIGILFSHNYIA